jgi:hypothetical protein
VIYCAEPFHETGTPTDAIIKTLKRAMAAEYSRELSVKVSAGQRRNAQMGFRNGGLAGFGFRRVAFEPDGSRRTVLMDGERKGIRNDRVTLEKGPEEEVRTVQQLFALFLDDGLSERGIANISTRGAYSPGRATPVPYLGVVVSLEKPLGQRYIWAGRLPESNSSTDAGILPRKRNWIAFVVSFPVRYSRGRM